MRLVLKPLFEAELTPDFTEVIKSKLLGKEVKTGEEVVVEIIGEPLRFKVLLAEPSPLRVTNSTRIEFSTRDLDVVNVEFEKEVEDVITFGKGFVVVLGNEVVVLSKDGQKVYSEEFKPLKGIRVTEDSVVVIHGSGIKIIRP
ncbi:ATPase [Thermococcus sp.]|uniref:DUF6849 domain-containing protein n=2 Tax=Thermococcus sp. TaxID=35749 RepID=UPI002620B9CF|nr:ATPase [Thermococcus sp.]